MYQKIRNMIKDKFLLATTTEKVQNIIGHINHRRKNVFFAFTKFIKQSILNYSLLRNKLYFIIKPLLKLIFTEDELKDLDKSFVLYQKEKLDNFIQHMTHRRKNVFLTFKNFEGHVFIHQISSLKLENYHMYKNLITEHGIYMIFFVVYFIWPLIFFFLNALILEEELIITIAPELIVVVLGFIVISILIFSYFPREILAVICILISLALLISELIISNRLALIPLTDSGAFILEIYHSNYLNIRRAMTTDRSLFAMDEVLAYYISLYPEQHLELLNCFENKQEKLESLLAKANVLSNKEVDAIVGEANRLYEQKKAELDSVLPIESKQSSWDVRTWNRAQWVGAITTATCVFIVLYMWYSGSGSGLAHSISENVSSVSAVIEPEILSAEKVERIKKMTTWKANNMLKADPIIRFFKWKAGNPSTVGIFVDDNWDYGLFFLEEKFE